MEDKLKNYWISQEAEKKLLKLHTDFEMQMFWGIDPYDKVIPKVYTFKEHRQEFDDESNNVQLIKTIANYHPTDGVKLGLSKYVGGMKDTGEWYYHKLLDLNSRELNNVINILKTM